MPIVKTSKEEIVKKAAGIFRKQGYFNTSIADLAELCGVRNALLYYYFKDKNDLLHEALKFSHEYFTRKAFQFAYDETMKPKERLSKMTDLLEKLFMGDKGGCIMAVTILETAYMNPAYLDTIRNFFDDWMKSLAHVYAINHPKKEAAERAERAVQDIEGGVLLTTLYRKEKYLLKALERTKQLAD